MLQEPRMTMERKFQTFRTKLARRVESSPSQFAGKSKLALFRRLRGEKIMSPRVLKAFWVNVLQTRSFPARTNAD